MTRNPSRDAVAVVGVGLSPYTRSDPRASLAAITLSACIDAIRDAGVAREEVDGISGSLGVSDTELQLALGLPAVRWSSNVRIPFGFQVQNAVNAVVAGACDVALVYHSRMHGPKRPADHPLWARSATIGSGTVVPWKSKVAADMTPEPGLMAGGVGYASWAGRYLHEFGVRREDVLAPIAINNRSNAAHNPNAVLTAPISVDDYLAAPLLREPFGLFDLDLPVTAADAFVLTTAERARDLDVPAVLIHSITSGRTASCREDQVASLHDTGQELVMSTLWRRSELTLDDIDVLLAYDGFTGINLMWLESAGYCRRGEAADFIRSNWSAERNRLEIGGRVPMNTHGGNLSEGATQGAGAFREAVTQLRHHAGARQVADAKAALWLSGGIVWNAGGAVLRLDER